jgi:pimeloyl-ACP methyl ester carboxylesterase
MADWTDGYWASPDGLRLHYRDYEGDPARPPILCIPGLTRNARDFEDVAGRLTGEWRLICVDLRGRGSSQHAPAGASYVPPVYVADLEALIGGLRLRRFVAFGTSLGGLVAMLLAWRDPARIAGVLVNDVGPEIEPAGIERIRSYVGRAQSWPTWAHAARYFAETQKAVYPGWDLDRWLVFAKRLCRLNRSGRIVLDYDMKIAEPLRAAAASDAAFDLWPAWRAFAGAPALLVRGEDSDLLSPDTAARMAAEVPGLEIATVGGVGHAPTLEEPEAEAAIDRLLARIAAAA